MDISIALDSYDDLFSDFDIRGYGERALSKDFLDELRVRLRKFRPAEDCSILFLVPADRRRPDQEVLIVDRVRRFFLERRDHHRREYRKTTARSLTFVAVGILLSVAANLLADRLTFLPLLKEFLLIPAWFFVWSGFELLLQKRGDILRRKRYYAALAGMDLLFGDME